MYTDKNALSAQRILELSKTFHTESRNVRVYNAAVGNSLGTLECNTSCYHFPRSKHQTQDRIVLAACFVLGACVAYSSTFTMKTVYSSETSKNFYHTIWCHNPALTDIIFSVLCLYLSITRV
jgi:hypothetical protein